MAQNKVKIKEMGLSNDHPEKEGILVDQSEMVAAVKSRLQRQKELEGMTVQAEGLKVVDGIKGGAGEGQSGQGAPAEPST